jgi:hypothetical protein
MCRRGTGLLSAGSCAAKLGTPAACWPPSACAAVQLLLRQSGRGVMRLYTISADDMITAAQYVIREHCRCDMAQYCYLQAVVEQSWARSCCLLAPLSLRSCATAAVSERQRRYAPLHDGEQRTVC